MEKLLSDIEKLGYQTDSPQLEEDGFSFSIYSKDDELLMNVYQEGYTPQEPVSSDLITLLDNYFR